jgi:hypothetical protein
LINDQNGARNALREICHVTEIDNPMLAMQYFTTTCVTGIETHWLPFWHFRTFWTYELSPKYIINSGVGNRAFVNHRISKMVTVSEIEEALGIENLRKKIMPLHSFAESIAVSHVADAVLNGELSVVEVGAIVSLFDTFDLPMAYTPQIIIEAGKCCLGMVLAHKIAQEMF